MDSGGFGEVLVEEGFCCELDGLLCVEACPVVVSFCEVALGSQQESAGSSLEELVVFSAHWRVHRYALCFN